jgi:hypothetical protein
MDNIKDPKNEVGFYCVECDTRYVKIHPYVHECPVCKKRYHEYGYENSPLLIGDYSNVGYLHDF